MGLGRGTVIEQAMQVGRLRFFFKLAGSALRRSWAVTGLTVGTISTALAILGAFTVALLELQRISDRMGAQLAVSAYFDPDPVAADLSDSEREDLLDAVRHWPEVEEATYLSRADALEAFRQELAQDAAVLEGLDETALPASVEVVLRPPLRTAQAARTVADRMRSFSAVHEVRFGEQRLLRLERVQRFARALCTILGVALVLATVAIVANTVRLTVFARKEEIEIMTLVGATSTFVKTPFLLEGLIQGVLGGGLALVWLRLLDGVLRSRFTGLLEASLGPVQLADHQWAVMGPLVLAGALLGLLGAAFGVFRFSRDT